MPFTVKSKTLL